MCMLEREPESKNWFTVVVMEKTFPFSNSLIRTAVHER